jgi:glycyl-tRNA synthetase
MVDMDVAIEALKALKVEASAAAHWLQQALGAAGGAAREDLRHAFFFSSSGSV